MDHLGFVSELSDRDKQREYFKTGIKILGVDDGGFRASNLIPPVDDQWTWIQANTHVLATLEQQNIVERKIDTDSKTVYTLAISTDALRADLRSLAKEIDGEPFDSFAALHGSDLDAFSDQDH